MGFLAQWLWYLLAFLVGSAVAWAGGCTSLLTADGDVEENLGGDLCAPIIRSAELS